MENIVNRQIEMISVCAADGALTPIRFRMEDGEHMLRSGRCTRRSGLRAGRSLSSAEGF